MTARRGAGSKIGNITIVQTEFTGHRHLNTLCGLGSFVLFIIIPPPQKRDRRTSKDVEESGKNNSRSTAISILRNSCRLTVHCEKETAWRKSGIQAY